MLTVLHSVHTTVSLAHDIYRYIYVVSSPERKWFQRIVYYTKGMHFGHIKAIGTKAKGHNVKRGLIMKVLIMELLSVYQAYCNIQCQIYTEFSNIAVPGTTGE